MGITFSKIGGALKRAVSPKARAAHKAQQQKLDQIRKNIRANKAGENQEVTELINRVQAEVEQDQFTKLKHSMPSAPTHQGGTLKKSKKRLERLERPTMTQKELEERLERLKGPIMTPEEFYERYKRLDESMHWSPR